MDIEEVARQYSMRELKPIAKKYGIATRCVKKIDIIKAFPPEALADLTGSGQGEAGPKVNPEAIINQ
jgi:hypothetical protein